MDGRKVVDYTSIALIKELYHAAAEAFSIFFCIQLDLLSSPIVQSQGKIVVTFNTQLEHKYVHLQQLFSMFPTVGTVVPLVFAFVERHCTSNVRPRSLLNGKDCDHTNQACRPMPIAR